MNNGMLVTIYIVSYQKFDFYKRAIDSAINQTYNNIELIISDDGSDHYPLDDVELYLSHKKDNIKRVLILNNKENVGTVKHENNLLRYANGRLFIPLAADDYFYNKEVVSKIVEEYNKNKFKVLSTSRLCLDEEGGFIRYYPHIGHRGIIEREMNTSEKQFKRYTEGRGLSFASGSAMCYEADFFRMMGGFDERFVLWEDGPFINKMTRKGFKIHFAFDIISICYHAGGISTNKNKKLLDDELLYNSVDRLIDKNKFGIYHQRAVIFWSIIGTTSKIDRLLLYIKYFDVCLYHYYHKITDSYLSKKDYLDYKKDSYNNPRS